MKNRLRTLFIAIVAVAFTSLSACDNAAENSKNALLNTGAKIGSGAMQGSLNEFNKAIKLDPKSARAYSARGAFKYATGDSKGAIADLSKAIELDPKSLAAYSGRGSAKFTTGDIPGATADFISVARLALFSSSAGESGKEGGNNSGGDSEKETGRDSGKDSGKDQ
jgi:tetratricopeptide (TPR) repeat protein